MDEEEFFKYIHLLTDPNTDQRLVQQVRHEFLNQPNFPFFALSYIAGDLSQPTDTAIALSLTKLIFRYSPALQELPDLVLKCFETFGFEQEFFADILCKLSTFDQDGYLQHLEEAQAEEPSLNNVCFFLFIYSTITENEIDPIERISVIMSKIGILIENNALNNEDRDYICARAALCGLKRIYYCLQQQSLSEFPQAYLEFCFSIVTSIPSYEKITDKAMQCFETIISHIIFKYNDIYQDSNFVEPFVDLLLFLANNYKDVAEIAIRMLLAYFKELSSKEDLSQIWDRLIPSLILCSTFNDIDEMSNNPEQFFSSLFPLEFDKILKQPPVSEVAALVFCNIMNSNIDDAVEFLFQDSDSILQKIYLIVSFIQIILNNKFATEMELNGATVEKLGEVVSTLLDADCPDDVNESLFNIYKLYILTITPIFGDESVFEQFPDPTDCTDSESLENSIVLSFYCRLVLNSLTMAMDTYKSEEIIDFILKIKPLCLGQDNQKAFSAFIFYMPKETAAFAEDFANIQLDTLSEILSEGDDDSSEQVEAIIESLQFVAKHACERIDFSNFLERYLSLREQYSGCGDRDMALYFSVITHFARVPENADLYFDFALESITINDNSSFVDDILRPFVIFLDRQDDFFVRNPDKMEQYIQTSLGIIRTVRVMDLEQNPVQIILNRNELISETDSVDYESIVLLLIKIVFTVDLDDSVLEELFDAIWMKLHSRTDDFMFKLVTCEFTAAVVLKNRKVVPQECIDLMLEFAAEGNLEINYHRALIGTALLTLIEENEEYARVGIRVLKDQIPLASFVCDDIYEVEYPAVEKILKFTPMLFVNISFEEPEDQLVH